MSIVAVNPGAYLKFGFTGTALGISYNAASLLGVDAKKWPHVAYSIDGGAFQITRLRASDAGRCNLAWWLAAGSHEAVLYFTSSDGLTSRWNATMILYLTGILVGVGGTIIAPAATEGGRMVAFGDSVTEGAWNLGAPGDLTDYSLFEDARLSWAQIVAADLDCELGVCAFGGQSYSNIYNSDIPILIDAWDFYYATNSRLVGGALDPAPNWILNNMGHNWAALPASVKAWLDAVRAAAPLAKIAQIIPFSQQNVANITQGFNDYQTATPDENCKLIDLGAIAYGKTDSVHPTVAGHATLAAAVTAAIQAAFSL